MRQVTKLEHSMQETNQATERSRSISHNHSLPNEYPPLHSIDQDTKSELYQRLSEAEIEVDRTANKSQQMVDQLNQTLQEQADYIRALEKRLMAQQADMNRTEANFKALVEHTSGMILSVDRDFRVLVINAQMRRFIKNCFHKEIRPGQLLTEHLPYDLKDRWIPHLRETFKAHSTQTIESYLISEKPRHLALAFNPMLDSNGSVYAVSLFCEDITEQRDTREAIEQNQQLLESINKS
ncbi:MAG: PAS domain-containing protein, partial [Bacteroidota bacterium]